jgi:hypothetical protein
VLDDAVHRRLAGNGGLVPIPVQVIVEFKSGTTLQEAGAALRGVGVVGSPGLMYQVVTPSYTWRAGFMEFYDGRLDYTPEQMAVNKGDENETRKILAESPDKHVSQSFV